MMSNVELPRNIWRSIVIKVITGISKRVNFNWKLHGYLTWLFKHSKTHSKEFTDIGSCGLHRIHIVFQKGNKKLDGNLMLFFVCFIECFKKATLEEKDYRRILSTNKFPLKFCATQWIENVAVAQRALEVYENIKKYVAKTGPSEGFRYWGVNKKKEHL